ncbi:MAG TPA: hypothetical protein VFF11_03975 [Candidatus Binatia bacterium]|nr:hypothetical protein [Candidatus Binatia bacterium]
MKTHIKFSAILAAMLGTAGGLLVLLSAHANPSAPPTNLPLPASKPAPTPAPAPQSAPPAPAPAAPAPAAPAPAVAPEPSTDNPGVLDGRRQFALSMIETGMDDKEIGSAGEVSRYQIMPSVWRHYTSSLHYRDPAVSLEVARQHWAALYESFKQRAHREPTDFDMYVLWNTRYGYYAKRDFDPNRLQTVVRDRAQRFVNLVELGASQYAAR